MQEKRISMEKTELKLGLQPFWFWNGDMKKEEIVSQILEMKAKGIPGIYDSSQTGYGSTLYVKRVL